MMHIVEIKGKYQTKTINLCKLTKNILQMN